MAGPIAIDTPDYQRGVVSAQKLLATVAAGAAKVTVGVPPNAETLIVISNGIPVTAYALCAGVTTGFAYPGARLPKTPSITSDTGFFFDVSSVTDEQVEISFSAAPIGPWYVYADAGTHLTADISKLVNGIGQQYVIPSVPNIAAGDHPPTELSVVNGSFTASGVLVAAPGAGKRLRLFSAVMHTNTAGLWAVLQNDSAGWLCVCGDVATVALNLPGQGWPLATNVPLNCSIGGGAGTVYAVAYYTTETV